jgi:signal transduction histidine kinase
MSDSPAPTVPARLRTLEADVWIKSIVGWHIAFWLLIILLGIRLATLYDVPIFRRWIGLAMIAVVVGAYAALVQRRTWQRGLSGLLYLSIIVPAAGILCWVDVSLTMFLFIAYAQIWIFSERLIVGALFGTLLTISCSVGMLIRFGWAPEPIRQIVPQMLVSLLFSLLLGWWISRIIIQSQERAELLAEIEAARAELSEAHRAQGAMAERERIARDIHDTLAQGFTSIIMLVQAATAEDLAGGSASSPRLVMIEEVARENLAEARSLVAAFAPAHLADGTLSEALRRIGAAAAKQSGLTVEVIAGHHSLRRTQEVVVLRAVQEGLANVVKHAGARHVVVRLEAVDGATRCTILDDGHGFAADAVTSGYGLSGMRARTEEVGGTFSVTSSPGTGARIELGFPTPVSEEQR